jgi:hypothetical protein
VTGFDPGSACIDDRTVTTREIAMLTMRKRPHAPLVLALIATALAGCAAMSPTAGLTPVPITDFQMVAGDWEGPARGMSAQHDDWIEVTFTPDGKYDFGIYRTIGVFGGKGALTLSDGKLQIQGERGSASFALYQGGAKRILQSHGVLSDGRAISATLSERKRAR